MNGTKIKTRELQPGDEFIMNSENGTVVEVREATHKEVLEVLGPVSPYLGDEWLTVVYRHPEAPTVDKKMLRSPGNRVLLVRRPEPTDPRIGADVVYHVNKREVAGDPEGQTYEAPGRGIVTAIEVGPNVTTITVHGKRHDGTEYDVTLTEGTDLIEWPGDEPDPSEGEYHQMLPGIAYDPEYDGLPD